MLINRSQTMNTIKLVWLMTNVAAACKPRGGKGGRYVDRPLRLLLHWHLLPCYINALHVFSVSIVPSTM